MPRKKLKKNDHGKPRFSLVPQLAMDEVIAVLEHGAEEYGEDNWRKCDRSDEKRYLDAIFRHARSALKGEEVDKKSKLSHYAHIACSAMFLAEFYAIKKAKEEDQQMRLPLDYDFTVGNK